MAGSEGCVLVRGVVVNEFPSFRVEFLEDRRLLSGTVPAVTPTPVTRVGPVNGGFEASPDFTGWQTAGNDLIQAADFHAPAEGALQAELSTGQIPNNGTTPTSAATLESFLNLSSGAL